MEAAGDVVDEEADILRRINPGGAPRAEPEGIDLEAAWRLASAAVVAEHNRLADPRAEAERLGPTQRFALNLPSDPVVVLPEGATRACEALSVERSSTVRQALAGIRDDLQRSSISRDEAARRIVALVDEFGLHGVPPPPALEPITEDDIGVVCWMLLRPA